MLERGQRFLEQGPQLPAEIDDIEREGMRLDARARGFLDMLGSKTQRLGAEFRDHDRLVVADAIRP